MKTFYIAAGILAPILSVLAETDCVVGAEYCGWNLADTLGWSTTPMRNDIRSTWQISVDDEQARNFMYRCNNARQASPIKFCDGKCFGPKARCGSASDFTRT